MFAHLLALPFLFGALTFLYMAWTVDSEYAPWMAPFLVVAVIVYILAPQINWWWYSKRPPRLSAGLAGILQRFSGFFQRLSPEDQVKFEGRVALFRMGTDWTPLNWPDDVLPPDVELALAAQAVALTFHRETFLFEKFEKVIIYPKPFPTPEHPYFHSSELFAPDGCLLFSAENLMQGFFNPDKMYNIGLHEYAKAFVLKYPDEAWPELPEENTWDLLQQISGMTREHVETMVGLAGLEPLPVAIHHFINFPDTFKLHWPQCWNAFNSIFNHTPALTP